jgi:RND family efflux transporter MFP subunit
VKKILLALIVSISASMAGSLSVTGTVVSDNQKMIGARYMGYVKDIYFEIGDKVKREDVLFELESAEFDIMKNQADLALEQADIMVEMYRERLDNIRREKALLQNSGSANMGANLENMSITADNLSAGLHAAQGLLENATVKVKQMATISNYLEVIAPNDGIIVQKRIRVGDIIVPGMLAMVLVDLDHLEIDAQISESNLLRVKVGQKVDINIPSIKHRTTGIIKSIVPGANPMAHTFAIRVTFKKDNDMIFPGLYAKLKIHY